MATGISANRLELLQIADAVAREKGIDKEIVIASIEEAIQKAARSRYGAEHDILQSFGYRVSAEKREELRRDYPPVAHPVVRRHPETGERHLFVNHVFTTGILGLEDQESKALLSYLTDRVKAPEYQVRFRWTPNAIVFWYNRATQHYAVLDYWPQPRVVERVTVQGTDRPHR